MITQGKLRVMMRGLTCAIIVTIAWSTAASPVGTNSKMPRTDVALAMAKSAPNWLELVNRYREASGLAPVSYEPAWDAGLLAHFTYLSKTPASLFTGAYRSEHTENPASPYYSAAGAREGAASDLLIGAPENWGPLQYINDWLEAPFHALGILNPTLGKVAFAESEGDGGIDILQGINEHPRAKGPVLFPGPGMSTDLTTYKSELPSPLQTCNWTEGALYGLPLIAELTASAESGLTASLDLPGGAVATKQNGGLCVVDSNDYQTTDTVYGPTGAKLLATYHAVFLIPRAPLVKGTYVATIDQPDRASVSWSFHVVGAP